MTPTQSIQLSQCVQGVQGAQVALELEHVERLEPHFEGQRWVLMLLHLLGDPLPPLPPIAGRRHHCADAALPDAELQQIEDPTELALCAGITRQAAWLRLQKRKDR